MTNAPWALVLDGALGEVLVARASLRPGEDIEVSLGERTDRMLGVLPSLERLFPTRDDRAAIVVVILGIGPGSYTGVRSAASAAVGIARALAVPVVQVASDAALRLASGRDAALPLGARESLLVDADVSRVVPRSAAPTPPTLDEIGDRYAQALVKVAGPYLHDARASDGPVRLRYPAAPRGLGDAPAAAR